MLNAILIATLLIGLGSPVGALAILALPHAYERARTLLLAFAVGVLLGVTFGDVLPDALHHAPAGQVAAVALVSGGVFYLLERLLHARGGEPPPADRIAPDRAKGVVLLVGASLHNAVDGVLVAVAFSSSFHLGVVTSLAVFAHEIPHELGDFVVLLQSGFSWNQAFVLNLLTALVAFAGALGAYWALGAVRGQIPNALAIAGASFLYIAASNAWTLLRTPAAPRERAAQWASLGLGAAVIVGLQLALG